MSGFSYDDLLKLIPKARPRKFPEPQRDPVLDHCIKLRKFHDEIEHLILLTANLKEVYDDSEREPILKSLPPVPEIPELIEKTSNEKKTNLAFEEVELSDESVMKLVSKSIACVFFILGYTDMSSHLLQMLSKAIIDYVKSLTEMIVQLSPEDGSISLDLLETALQRKGINGIGELYSFYTQKIVKFHDKFYLKCKCLCDDLKNNLKKPDAPAVENITESSVGEQCSTDVREKKQNNEASTEDSIKYSLDSGMLAEDLFVYRKVKQKSVRFTFETPICEISNEKELCISTDQEKFLAKNSVFTESFSNLRNEFMENAVSFECKNFDSTSVVSKNNSKVTGLFNNSFYCDAEILDDSKSIICDVDKVPDKSALCHSDDKSSDQDVIIVDAEKDNRNALGSELFDESWDQGANIVSDEEEVSDNNAFYSELSEESSERDTSVVPDEEKILNKYAIGYESIDDSSDQGANIFSPNEKASDKNVFYSELIKESSEQYASIVPGEEKGSSINPINPELTDEPSNQDVNIVIDEKKSTYIKVFDSELIDESSVRDTSVVPNEEKTFNKNAVDSELICEPWDQDANVVSIEEKAFDKYTIGSELTDDSSYLAPNEEKTLVDSVIGSESHTNLENVFSEKVVFSRCTKPISDLSGELNSAVCKHITKQSSISVYNSNDKPPLNRKAIRKLVDLENFNSLSDSNTGTKKKRPKLMKRKKVFENDTSMETVPPKMKDDLENFEQSSSSGDYNIDSTKNLETMPEENSFCNCHNTKASSITINNSEIMNSMPDVSSSENETEQIWVSL